MAAVHATAAERQLDGAGDVQRALAVGHDDAGTLQGGGEAAAALHGRRAPGQGLEHLGQGLARGIHPAFRLGRCRVVRGGRGEARRGAETFAQRADQVQLVLAPDQGEGGQALEAGGDGRRIRGDRRREVRR